MSANGSNIYVIFRFRWKEQLQRIGVTVNDSLVVENDGCGRFEGSDFVQEFHKITTQYCQALNSVVPIFTYMVSFVISGQLIPSYAGKY